MRLKIKTIILLLSLFVSDFATARTSGFTICNKSETGSLAVSIVNYSGNALFQLWTSSGWYGVDPGVCEELITGTNMKNNTYYLRVLKKHGEDDFRAYIPSKNRQDKLFCVREISKFDEGFKLQKKTLKALKSCPSDYSLKLFNMVVKSDERTNATLTLDW